MVRFSVAFGGVLHPDLRVFGAVIHNNINQDPAAWMGAGACAIHFRRLDGSPLAARAPVAIELIERIVMNRFAIEMSLPLGIVLPNRIRSLEILLLQGLEEVLYDVLFTPIAEPPSEKQNDHDDRDDEDEALPL